MNPLTIDRTDEILARHSRLKGRSHLGPRYQRGGPLAHTIAFDDDYLSDDQFQTKVLRGVEALTAQIDRIDGKTKTAFEELTRLKKVANDQDANAKAFVRKLDEVQSLLHKESRASFGDPIRRIQNNEDLRLRINAAVRLAVCGKDGDMLSLVKGRFPEYIVKEVEQRALGEDSSPGSTLINQHLAGEIYDTLESYGIWNSFAVRRVTTKTNIFPVKTARPVAVAIVSEGTQIPDDSNKAGVTVTATIVDVAVLLNVFLRLIQDAEFDVTADVLDDFMEAIAYRLDWFCTQADGTSDTTDGTMVGIFGGGGTPANAAAGNTTVEATQEKDWRNCLTTVDAAVLQRNAMWWIHPQLLVRALAVKDGNGRCIWLSALEAPNPKGIGSIFGYPTKLASVCPSTNAAGAKVAAFGDPNGQVVALRSDFDFAASDDFKWDYYQRSFRGIARAATKVRRATAFAILTLPAA